MHFDRLRRREFTALLGGAAVGWPLAVDAQQSGKLPIIGLLGANQSSESQWVATFVQRVRELGWIEGRTVAIEYRWAEGRAERAAEIATEFVRLKVSVIVTWGTSPALAVKEATSTIPIVFASAGDPVASGLVASLARPGGNITGLSQQQTDLAGKRLELLHELIPGLRRLAILAEGGSPIAGPIIREVQAAANTLGLEVIPFEIQRGEDITPGFGAFERRAEALYVVSTPLIFTNRARIHTLAMAARLPTIYAYREYVEAGGLISYGVNMPRLIRRAGDFVDKILRGANPDDIPVEQPTKFDLVINLTTAKALRLQIPPTLLALADEVIE
jgi:putative tryptophan/tyrosine transport system substrate-binding protein